MNEHTLTRSLAKSLYSTLRRFVGELNGEETGTEAPRPASNVIHDDKGWSYPMHDAVRERYQRDCI